MLRWRVALAALLGLWAVCDDPAATAATRRHAAHAPSRHQAAAVLRQTHRRAVSARLGRGQRGKASIYALGLRGKRMADGTPFNPASNAAASKTLPLGTTARVTNLTNGRTAVVKIRDRGPYRAGRIIDVSPGSANALGMRRDGVAPVAVAPLVAPRAGAPD